MTKKDYILIAKAIRESRQNVGKTLSERQQTIDEVVNMLSHYLRQQNDRFDWFKFQEACNLES